MHKRKYHKIGSNLHPLRFWGSCIFLFWYEKRVRYVTHPLERITGKLAYWMGCQFLS